MSYSIAIKAASKALAKLAVAAKFEEIVAQQACHARDRAQALSAADAFIDLVTDDDSKDISVSMNGSLSGQWEGNDVTRITTASVSIYASLTDREATA